ncbi:hypothetical protein RD792_012296 [Penstemon davidsonii]|uniref:CCHC-type domain-containing protein n=1 Tax=Penstemon davidsonii TaxID=160366 RepID=A0ABR0CXW8_9LAMI|nr:hypothetical protein RD792_012296 [Penstemon davidsonii]
MAADEGKMKLEKFDGADFGFWKMQIEDYLYQKNLFLPLQEEKPESMKDDEWKLHDRQALGVIRLTLSRNVAFNIAKEKTTAGLMKALSNMYEKPSASNKVHLMRRLFNLRMTEGASVAQHLNELSTITTQLSSVEIEFDDEVQALLLLSSLPESWNATVTAVSSSSGSNKLKFNDVRDLVLNEEIRRRESGETSTPSALSTESRARSINNNRGRSNHRGRSKNGRSRSRNPSNSGNSKTVECWNCGKVGHYKNQCKSAPKNQTTKIEANVASTSTQDDVLICSLESKEESWVLDSGASFHATSQKRLFGEYVSGNLGKVYLGDDQPCDIVGKGTVKIKLNGSEWKLKDVRHIPDLRKNLISVGQLASEGYTTIFHGDDWKISKVEELGIKPLLPPYLDPTLKAEDLITGVNFASGGAEYDPITSHISSALSLSKQLELFKDYITKLKQIAGEERTSTILMKSLIIVVFGSNDITNTYYGGTLRRSHYDISSYADLLISYSSGFVQALYRLGARRIDVFGLAPLGCLPSQKTLKGGAERECVELYNQAAQLFNDKLSAELISVNNRFPDARMIYMDMYDHPLDLLNNPNKYG